MPAYNQPLNYSPNGSFGIRWMDMFNLLPMNLRIQSLNTPSTKDWQRSIIPEFQNYLVPKIIQSSIPTDELVSPFDVVSIYELIEFAKKVENEIFQMASSKVEYHHLLAEKIYEIQNKLKEKRQNETNQAGASLSEPHQIGLNQTGSHEYRQQQHMQLYYQSGILKELCQYNQYS